MSHFELTTERYEPVAKTDNILIGIGTDLDTVHAQENSSYAMI